MIADSMPKKIAKQCRERWSTKLDPKIKKTPWTDNEDERIYMLYKKHGPRWTTIAAELEGRHENQIKNRFNQHLDGGVHKSKAKLKKLNKKKIATSD